MSYHVLQIGDEMRWGDLGSWHFSASLGMQMAAGGAAEECRWSGTRWEIELEEGWAREGWVGGDFLKAKWGCTVW